MKVTLEAVVVDGAAVENRFSIKGDYGLIGGEVVKITSDSHIFRAEKKDYSANELLAIFKAIKGLKPKRERKAKAVKAPKVEKDAKDAKVQKAA